MLFQISLMIIDALCGIDRSPGKTDKLSRAWAQARARGDLRQVAYIDHTYLHTKVTGCCWSSSGLPAWAPRSSIAAHSGRTSVDDTPCGLVAAAEDPVRGPEAVNQEGQFSGGRLGHLRVIRVQATVALPQLLNDLVSVFKQKSLAN